MISWNECDAQFAKHAERIARVDSNGWMTSTPVVGRRRRGVVASTTAIFAGATARTGLALIVLGRWLSAREHSVEVS
jgi:hypothetical protein